MATTYCELVWDNICSTERVKAGSAYNRLLCHTFLGVFIRTCRERRWLAVNRHHVVLEFMNNPQSTGLRLGPKKRVALLLAIYITVV